MEREKGGGVEGGGRGKGAKEGRRKGGAERGRALGLRLRREGE